VRAPTLMVHGSADRLVPLASARRVARLRPDWAFVVFDDVGHIPHVEVPERFAATVGRWLAGSGRAAAAASDRGSGGLDAPWTA
jgi:pimeloyl-ACP methyl ester carboxylesterase